MTYLDSIAVEIRQRVPSDKLPAGDTTLLFRLYAVLVLAKGEDVTATDVHNAWAVWIQETVGSHPALRPFEDLDEETQRADVPYVDALRAVARRITVVNRGGDS